MIYMNNQRYMAAIILSEKQCQEHLKEANKSCDGEWVRAGVGVMGRGEQGGKIPRPVSWQLPTFLGLLVLYS